MKIAFDVDVLAKQMRINDMVHQVADWGYKYIEQSPHPRINPFYSKNLGYVYSSPHGFFYDQGKGDVRSMLQYAGDELTHVLFADTFNQTMDCRYIANPPWLNANGRADITIHQHLAMGGDNIACVSYFGFPEKMATQAPEARERIQRELLDR